MPALLSAGLCLAIVASRCQGRRFVVYPEAEVAAVKDVHLYKGQPVCQACHLRRELGLVDDPVRLCQRCHSFGHRSHPVQVPVKGDLLVGLPLGEGRSVLCHTCHDPHDVRAYRHGLRMELTPMCLKCHPDH